MRNEMDQLCPLEVEFFEAPIGDGLLRLATGRAFCIDIRVGCFHKKYIIKKTVECDEFETRAFHELCSAATTLQETLEWRRNK